VNKSSRVESSTANHDGGQLTTTYPDNIGDEGVDAELRRAVRTKYIKSADSTWQFKAGDLLISEPSPTTGKIGHPTVVLLSRSERSKERAALAPPGRRRTDRSASSGPAINNSQASRIAFSPRRPPRHPRTFGHGADHCGSYRHTRAEPSKRTVTPLYLRCSRPALFVRMKRRHPQMPDVWGRFAC
jgi:hypothetical protein